MPDPSVSPQIFADLNPSQVEAVEATDGPVLILAGAGSGKTKCLTHRLAYMVESRKATLDQILAITFTNKAAGELAGRIAKILGQDFSESRNPAFAMEGAGKTRTRPFVRP
jgi:DNA helicase-2/ATP-dependent DNA helicase PcrA